MGAGWIGAKEKTMIGYMHTTTSAGDPLPPAELDIARRANRVSDVFYGIAPTWGGERAREIAERAATALDRLSGAELVAAIRRPLAARPMQLRPVSSPELEAPPIPPECLTP